MKKMLLASTIVLAAVVAQAGEEKTAPVAPAAGEMTAPADKKAEGHAHGGKPAPKKGAAKH